MTTITLELPDDLAARLESIPPQERNRYAVAALREKLEEEDEQEIPENYPGKFPNPLRREDCTPDEIAAIERGFADIDAGRTIPGETFFAEAFARVGLAYPPRSAETSSGGETT